MRHFLTTLTILTLVAVAPAALAAPSANLWKRWQQHDSHSSATIDHKAFSTFLEKYVVPHENGVNGVRYAAVTKKSKQRLAHYIKRMESVKIDHYNRDVQRAYWINLYNAETLQLVLDHYPVKSIRDIGGGLFSSGPWDEKVLTVEGEKLSLNDIEHRILRPIWHDTLTHYGVNCASMSCPSLRASAYTGASVHARLKANAKKYINSPAGVRIHNNQVTVSKIYQWYAADFGSNQSAVIQYLRHYARPGLAARLKRIGHIADYAYDWSLNDEKDIEADEHKS